LLTTITG